MDLPGEIDRVCDVSLSGRECPAKDSFEGRPSAPFSAPFPAPSLERTKIVGQAAGRAATLSPVIIDIHDVPHTDAGTLAPGPELTLFHAAASENERDDYGHDDFFEPIESYFAGPVDDAWGTHVRLVALPAGLAPSDATASDVVGTANLDFPLRGNDDVAFAYAAIRPHARGRGHGRALFEELGRRIAASGRHRVMAWATNDVLPADHPDAMIPPTGSGVVDGASPASRWLAANGFTLEQGERYSALDLPAPGDATAWAKIRTFRDVAAARAGSDYELVAFTDVPEDLRDAMARLHTRMSTDAPSAGMEFGEETWDAARVAAQDAKNRTRGREILALAVRHAPSGELVAYTDLAWPGHSPAGIWQEDTFVLAEHRGRRLGMWLKAAMLERLREANPAAARIHTWNADENRYMLDINEALGFTPRKTEAAWLKVLSEAGEAGTSGA